MDEVAIELNQSVRAVSPHSVEAEQSVLGSLLLDNGSFDHIHWLRESDFYRDDHRTIYAAIRAILESGKPCDNLLLAEALQARGVLSQVGGHDYLSSLVVHTPSAANIKHYATVVRRRSQSRELQALAVELTEAATSGAHDPVQIAEVVTNRTFSILDGDNRTDIQHYSRAVADAVDWMDAPVQGISTGYSSLDALFTLRPGDLIVVAGRPSMGKSSLALNIAEHVGIDKPVAVFSLEMKARQIGARSVRWHEHLSNRSDAVTQLMDRKIWIDDSPAMTIGLMRLRLQRIKRKNGLALVVVDYLQLMKWEGDNRTQEIGSLSRGLKAIAKEFNVPVIAVSQLNRGVEGRQDKRPLMSDLRESGDLEQDADVIVMLYRDDYYDELSPHVGFAEALIRKQREGPVGRAWLKFESQYARFKDFTGHPPVIHTPLAATSGTVKVKDFKASAAGDA